MKEERENEKKLKRSVRNTIRPMVGWYGIKLQEIREAPVDDRPRMLERLYRISKKNKHLGVMIARAGIINPVNYPKYPPELKILEYKSLDCVCQDPCRIHEENWLVLGEYSSDHPIK